MKELVYSCNRFKYLQVRRWRWILAIFLLLFILLLFITLKNTSEPVRLIAEQWEIHASNLNQTDYSPFILATGAKTYMLSAINSLKDNNDNEIYISTLDSTKGNGHFKCCVLLNNKSMLTVSAQLYYIHRHIDFLPFITQIFYPASYDATQYVCSVPKLQQSKPQYISLTKHVCSHDSNHYLPVQKQVIVPEGLAICAKVAFGDQLKASRLIEWMEMQKLLGVDKVLIFNLNCPQHIQRVFQYYISEGFLEVQNYSQPGHIPGYSKRGFKYKEQVNPQFSHDKHLTVLDCHQRLGGYKYILAGDFDEIIIPRKHRTLKELLTDLTKQNPTAAGFYFQVQFHLEEWGRYRTDTSIYFQQYLKAQKPRWECEKYIYLTDRCYSAKIHSFFYKSPFKSHNVDPSIATVQHYRKCPLSWTNCNKYDLIYDLVAKYEEIHTYNTYQVLDKLNMKSFDEVK